MAACIALCLGSPAGAQNRVPPRADSSQRSLHAFLRDRHRQDWDDIRSVRFEGYVPALRYAAARIDLNDDGRREAIVHIMHPANGTGGGGIDIFTPSGRSWRLIAWTSIGHMPVRVLNTRTHGWRDLGIIVAGGGVIPGYEARLRFNGRTYPYNPSMPPAQRLRGRVPGRILISRYDRGRPLFP